MNKVKFITILLLLLSGIQSVLAQDDLFKKLDTEFPDTKQYTRATFKTTKITFGQSIETRKKGILEVNLNSKFWNVPNSRAQVFGADRVTVRFGLEYAFSDRFTFGLGGATFDGIFNGFGKYRLLRQTSSNKKTPIGITLFQSVSHLTRSYNGILRPNEFSDRFSYTSQAIIARKFTRNFSLQIVPTFIHRASRQFVADSNNHFAIGFGARYKVGGHVSIVSEYYYVANRIESLPAFDPFALGVNWELSDFNLQFLLTNTRNFDEATNITTTFNNFNFRDGNLHIGVSATYTIHFKDNTIKNTFKD